MKIQKEQPITEEQKIHEEWYNKAKSQTPDTIGSFIKKLTSEYHHDYGTICHAAAASAIGAVWAVDKSSQGGITGFQAGVIMWEFLKHWSYDSNKCGLKIVDYDDLLFPQYEFKFNKTLTINHWKALQQEAQKNIDNNSGDFVSPNVIEHWKSIVNGEVPFGFIIDDED